MILGVDFIHDNDTKGDGHKFLLGIKRTLPAPFCLIRIKRDPLFNRHYTVNNFCMQRKIRYYTGH